MTIADRILSGAKEVEAWPEWKREAFAKAGNHNPACANEAYDRAASDDDKNAPRFISCPCPKCSARN